MLSRLGSHEQCGPASLSKIEKGRQNYIYP